MGEDWIAWAKEKTGIHSVRSVYHALVGRNHEEEMLRHDTIPSSSVNDSEVWKRLWKLPVIPKVRVFWWRVLRGILPDYRTLTRRHIMENNTCGICKAESETLMHALIECSHARLFWETAKEMLLVKLPRLHPLTWARDVLCESSFDQRDSPVIVSVMYSIWTSRNNLTHGEASFNPAKTMELVKETLQALEVPKVKTMIKKNRPVCKWQKPPIGTVKINSDGAIRVENNLASTGVVARDDRSFRGDLGRVYAGISDPLKHWLLGMQLFLPIRGVLQG